MLGALSLLQVEASSLGRGGGERGRGSSAPLRNLVDEHRRWGRWKWLFSHHSGQHLFPATLFANQGGPGAAFARYVCVHFM